MAPLVTLNQRRNFLDNAELVRRLHAVGEHQKASLLYRGTSGMAHRMHRGFRDGKLPHRYGLQIVPTFEQAIRTKAHKVSLPPLRATNFWNSPAYQALLNQQQQVETDAELEARRAQLEAL